MNQQKQPKRQVIASVVKSQDPSKPDYIKMRDTGECFSLESPKQQREKLEEAVKNGKITEEYAQKVRERLDKIPDFVRFEVVKYNK